MLFNKITLLSLFIFFILSACSITENEAQQKQLRDLHASLLKVQQTNQKTQIELDNTNAALKATQAEVDKLTVLLNDAKKTPIAEKKTTKFHDKTILGQSEWVYLSKVKSHFEARIDTGAATSSLHAINIERFERDGKKWVRFNLADNNAKKTKNIEAKIIRFVRITQSEQSEDDKRLVVKLHIRIGDIEQATEFTLTDRSHMEYPILIGRTFIQDLAVVDVSREYIHPKYKSKK